MERTEHYVSAIWRTDDGSGGVLLQLATPDAATAETALERARNAFHAYVATPAGAGGGARERRGLELGRRRAGAPRRAARRAWIGGAHRARRGLASRPRRELRGAPRG